MNYRVVRRIRGEQTSAANNLAILLQGPPPYGELRHREEALALLGWATQIAPGGPLRPRRLGHSNRTRWQLKI
eukprot:5261197-Pyramimonas_sp.AAC.1